MNKEKAIRKLKIGMKEMCNGCYRVRKAANLKQPDIDYCFINCSIHALTNLMIKELDENG